VSSLHVTFNTEEEAELCEGAGFLSRVGVQYHWHNRGYSTFDEFLAEFLQRKRNTLRKERRKVEGAGVTLQRLTGDDIKPHHWDAFYRFYLRTTDKKFGQAYLTRQFFEIIGETMSDKVRARQVGKG
jgi:predicted N-acyltransferase